MSDIPVLPAGLDLWQLHGSPTLNSNEPPVASLADLGREADMVLSGTVVDIRKGRTIEPGSPGAIQLDQLVIRPTGQPDRTVTVNLTRAYFLNSVDIEQFRDLLPTGEFAFFINVDGSEAFCAYNNLCVFGPAGGSALDTPMNRGALAGLKEGDTITTIADVIAAAGGVKGL